MAPSTPLPAAGRLPARWSHAAAVVLAAVFVMVITWMTFRQYAVFHLKAPDVATFGQAIWNTLQGRFLFATTIQRSILSYHFTPIFAFLSPLLWLWEDIRILFLAQTLGIAAAGLLLYAAVYPRLKGLAPLFLLVFYLNPAIHEIAVHELRRAPFAIPFLALLAYGLLRHQRWPIIVGAFLALLVKEDLGIVVFMSGLYLFFIVRDRWLGLSLSVVGVTAVLLLTFCIIPTLHPAASGFSCTANYPQLNAFTAEEELAAVASSDSGAAAGIDAIVGPLLRSPLQTLGRMFDSAGLAALWRIFLPLGLLLPLLGWEWLLIALPSMGLMLLSTSPQLHAMRDWYLSPVIVFLLMATTGGLLRLPERWRPWAMAGLLATTLVGYRMDSFLPGGSNFLPIRYQVTDTHQRASQILQTVSPQAAVAAQDAFVSHLAFRENLYLYPWYREEEDPLDLIILDRNLKHYPFDQQGIIDEINNLVANPAYTIQTEWDGLYVFAATPATPPLPAVTLNATAEEAIHLPRAELAVGGAARPYTPLVSADPPTAAHLETIRVTLYWEALAKPTAERTVSVRLQAADGFITAQQDNLPSGGARPTTWWEPGWFFRDVYYLTVPEGAPAGIYTISLLLYDTATLDPVPFDQGEELQLGQIEVK